MPSINPASDRTSQIRYCLTAGNGSSNCCSGPVGPPGPSGPEGPPGSITAPGAVWDILYSDGSSGASASPYFTYDILNDRLAVGQGGAGLAKLQSSNNQIAVGAGAGAQQTGASVIAIGTNAGYGQSAEYAIAIGYGAGYSQSNTAQQAVAIGSYAGHSQTSSSIMLNASGTQGATTDYGIAGFFVNPIRAINTGNLPSMCYNAATSEVVCSTAPPFKGYAAGIFDNRATNTITVTTTAGTPTYDTIGPHTGITLASPATHIQLGSYGIYEVSSTIQCSATAGATTNAYISGWHQLDAITAPTDGSLFARTVTVGATGSALLTVTNMLNYATGPGHVSLVLVAEHSNAVVTTINVGSSPTNPIIPGVVTSIKLVG